LSRPAGLWPYAGTSDLAPGYYPLPTDTDTHTDRETGFRRDGQAELSRPAGLWPYAGTSDLAPRYYPDRQSDIHTYRHRHAYRHTLRQTDRETYRETHRGS